MNKNGIVFYMGFITKIEMRGAPRPQAPEGLWGARVAVSSKQRAPHNPSGARRGGAPCGWETARAPQPLRGPEGGGAPR